VVFVAGQPGAGKTTTTEAVVDRLRERGAPIVVNSDFYKPYHPEYGRLLVSDDKTAAPYTSPDGRRWTAMAETRTSTGRRRHPGSTRPLLRDGGLPHPTGADSSESWNASRCRTAGTRPRRVSVVSRAARASAPLSVAARVARSVRATTWRATGRRRSS
jgi:hypothetical protein